MIEKTRKVARTILAVLIALAAAVPLAAPALGVGRTAEVYAVVAVGAGIVTRALHSAAAAPVLRWLGLSVDEE